MCSIKCKDRSKTKCDWIGTWVKKVKTKQYQSIGLETRLNNMQVKQLKLIQFYFLKFANESAMKETETKS